MEPLHIFILTLLVFIGSFVGTATGFGTSTIMVPVLVLFFPIPVVLFFVGLIHLAGDMWKIVLFKKGIDWKIILGFALPGIAASYLGASLTLQAHGPFLKRLLGAFLFSYVLFLLKKKKWALPKEKSTAITGGILYGLSAGFFGVGGALRGAFLLAFNLSKEVYIFTSGVIGLFIDITRISRYFAGGIRLENSLFAGLLIGIPVSYAGAALAKKLVDHLPKKYFRMFVSVFLALVAIKLLFWP
jgi:hypothetical protein